MKINNEDRISRKFLKKILHYNPDTGDFIWLISRGGRKRGAKAGRILKDRYRGLKILKRSYLEHRLAWFYQTGRWPPGEMDHKNLNRDDNRWDNLRLATASQNQYNTKVRRGSPFKGVTWHAKAGAWQAQVKWQGRNRYLGLFDTEKGAAAAYAAFAAKHFAEWARFS